DLDRAPTGCWHRALPSSRGDQALVNHRSKRGFLGVFVPDGLDHGNRVPAFGQDDLLAGPHGPNGLGETLVGLAKSESHVVMILHSDGERCWSRRWARRALAANSRLCCNILNEFATAGIRRE